MSYKIWRAEGFLLVDTLFLPKTSRDSRTPNMAGVAEDRMYSGSYFLKQFYRCYFFFYNFIPSCKLPYRII